MNADYSGRRLKNYTDFSYVRRLSFYWSGADGTCGLEVEGQTPSTLCSSIQIYSRVSMARNAPGSGSGWQTTTTRLRLALQCLFRVEFIWHFVADSIKLQVLIFLFSGKFCELIWIVILQTNILIPFPFYSIP